MDIYKNICL